MTGLGHDMSWGLNLPNRGPLFGTSGIPNLLAMASIADSSEFFDSVWVGDSLIDRPRLEANVLLGALSQTTHSVRVGISCAASMVVRDPLLLSIQWSTIDWLTAGRLIITACMGGGVPDELEPYGLDRSDRVPRIRESLQLIPKLWQERQVSHDGDIWSYEDIAVRPQPVQEPHPPIWYAVTPDEERLSPERVDRALLRAVDYANGWQGTWIHADAYGRLASRVRSLASERGVPDAMNFPCTMPLHLNIGMNREAAWDDARWYLDKYYPKDFVTGEGSLAESTIHRTLAYGSPTDCFERIAAYVEAGVSGLIVRFAARDQLSQLELFLRELAPMIDDAGWSALPIAA